jgi:hypothetical protein
MPATHAEPTGRERILRWLQSRRVVVRDESMLPTLRPGDRLRVDRRAYRDRLPDQGELVVIVDPEADGRWLVKRVGLIEPAGPGRAVARLVMVSDNPGAARDSRTFGAVGTDRLVGRPYVRYAPVDRQGPLD